MICIFFFGMSSLFALSGMEQNISKEHKQALFGRDLKNPIGFFSEIAEIGGCMYNLYKMEDTKPGKLVISVNFSDPLPSLEDEESKKILIWWWIRKGQDVHLRLPNKSTWLEKQEKEILENYSELIKEELHGIPMQGNIVRIKSFLAGMQ